MKENNTHSNKVLRYLGDGLILRRAVESDAKPLAAFNARIHSEDGPDTPDERVGAWTRDLFTVFHPTFDIADFTIVEDANTGEIVSSLNTISQTWMYEGIPFGVGRPELVGTSMEYRNRGLVRAQFEVIHQWSQARGEKLQAITGIPYYYRQFGYEMGVSLGGGRTGYEPQIPKLKGDEQEPFIIRPAEEDDIGFILELYEHASSRCLLSCLRDETVWRYELSGKSEKNVNRSEIRLIETVDGEKVGYLAHSPFIWGPHMVATAYEVKPGISWEVVTPSVIRYLFHTGEQYAAREEDGPGCSGFGFWGGSQHPVYDVLADNLPRIRKPYAWFVRLPDIPDFVQHIAPALEKRLTNSPFSGHTGELKLTFYRRGLKMTFENGRIKETEAWEPTPHGHSGDAAFPDLTFLQLLFGYRSLDELDDAFADCWRSDETAGLIKVLFPKKPSNIWPVS